MNNIINLYHLVCEECQEHSINVLKKCVESCNTTFIETQFNLNTFSNKSFNDLVTILTSKNALELIDKDDKIGITNLLSLNAIVIVVSRLLEHSNCFAECTTEEGLYMLHNSIIERYTSLLNYSAQVGDLVLFQTCCSSWSFFSYIDDINAQLNIIGRKIGKAFCHAVIYNKIEIIEYVFSWFESSKCLYNQFWYINGNKPYYLSIIIQALFKYMTSILLHVSKGETLEVEFCDYYCDSDRDCSLETDIDPKIIHIEMEQGTAITYLERLEQLVKNCYNEIDWFYRAVPMSLFDNTVFIDINSCFTIYISSGDLTIKNFE